LQKKENVEVRTYEIIYKLIDDITLAFKGLLEPEIKRIDKGKAEVREIFKLPKIGIIAGSYILEGEVERGNLVNVIREGKLIHEGKVSTLHRFKEDIKKVSAGYECGIRLEGFQDLSKGDIMEFYEEK
jgi:translation initiation factor IF-2